MYVIPFLIIVEFWHSGSGLIPPFSPASHRSDINVDHRCGQESPVLPCLSAQS